MRSFDQPRRVMQDIYSGLKNPQEIPNPRLHCLNFVHKNKTMKQRTCHSCFSQKYEHPWQLKDKDYKSNHWFGVQNPVRCRNQRKSLNEIISSAPTSDAQTYMIRLQESSRKSWLIDFTHLNYVHEDYIMMKTKNLSWLIQAENLNILDTLKITKASTESDLISRIQSDNGAINAESMQGLSWDHLISLQVMQRHMLRLEESSRKSQLHSYFTTSIMFMKYIMTKTKQNFLQLLQAENLKILDTWKTTKATTDWLSRIHLNDSEINVLCIMHSNMT